MGFNGATAMKPWKSTRLHRKNPRRGSFNGATAMKPWKRPQDLFEWCLFPRLQWGHGDEAVEENEMASATVATSGRFNGATAMKPWKRLKPRTIKHRKSA